jgi:lipopolysaccharide biosynthesis protein
MPEVRLICFYLPQFYPIPENDEWWGKGFTEWTNVVRAKPLFPGHYQPHLPADLGFYDLRLPEAREAQAALAREHGVNGFCYYHYWFNGRRVLERPFNEVLASGKPDFPFCLCWANENWTRMWDGGENNVLLAQNYTHADDLAHIQSLLPAFRDPRYIRIDDRPLFLVYRTGLLPNPRRTAEIWRETARRSGVGDPYLVRVESHFELTDPREIGFDASVEFAPFNGETMPPMGRDAFGKFLVRLSLLNRAFLDNAIFEYAEMAESMMTRPDPPFTRFHCVSPGWDNTARRKAGAMVLARSSPQVFQRWVQVAVARTQKKFSGDEGLVFINAWNEWAEGNHLEPDLHWGRAYLEATRAGLVEVDPGPSESQPAASIIHLHGIRSFYWRLLERIKATNSGKLLSYLRLRPRRLRPSRVDNTSDFLAHGNKER